MWACFVHIVVYYSLVLIYLSGNQIILAQWWQEAQKIIRCCEHWWAEQMLLRAYVFDKYNFLINIRVACILLDLDCKIDFKIVLYLTCHIARISISYFVHTWIHVHVRCIAAANRVIGINFSIACLADILFSITLLENMVLTSACHSSTWQVLALCTQAKYCTCVVHIT